MRQFYVFYEHCYFHLFLILTFVLILMSSWNDVYYAEYENATCVIYFYFWKIILYKIVFYPLFFYNFE